MIALFTILLLLAPAGNAGGDRDKVPAKKMPGSAEPAPGLGKGLKQIGPHSFEIKWDEAHLLIASMPFIAKQLWVSEVRRKGEFIGYRMRHIAKDSLVFKAGFRNGDIMIRVNGRSMQEPLKLLLKLLDQDQTVVELERDGKIVKHTYKFVR